MKDIFNQLPGQWTLERHIQTPDSKGMLKGKCNFTVMDDGRLLCEENGQMEINGQKTSASRSYIYEFRNDRIYIIYNDPHRKGDVLHELEFSSDKGQYVATHCHLCGQDTYDLTFTMVTPDSITMNYTVKGPHKDYKMQTQLSRQI